MNNQQTADEIKNEFGTTALNDIHACMLIFGKELEEDKETVRYKAIFKGEPGDIIACLTELISQADRQYPSVAMALVTQLLPKIHIPGNDIADDPVRDGIKHLHHVIHERLNSFMSHRRVH